MRKIKKWNYLLLFGISLFLLNCEQNELINTLQNQSNNINTTKTVSPKDIPNVISFIQSKSNSKMEFNLSKNNQDEFMRNNHEENLVLASVVTDQIKQITNSYGKSNYTFKLIEQETKDGIYFLNLVVKEYKDSFYLYIVKYVPSINWIRNYRSETDFDNFTGFIYIYNSEGVYAGYSEFNNGNSISINKSYPCPDTDDNNSNSSGGGSTYNDATNGSNSNGTNSYDSLFGGDFGGTNCSWSIYTQYNCSCNGELVGVHDHIPSTIVVELFCGDINKSMRNMIDCPPYDTEEECFLTNGDPCPNGCDANGNCIQNIDEIENPSTSINIDREDFVNLEDFLNHIDDCNKIQSFLDNPDIAAKITELKGNRNLHYETGYDQNLNGNFTELHLNPASNGTSLSYDPSTTSVGYLHVHTNDYENGEFHLITGNPIEIRPIKIFSPRDVTTYLKMYLNATTNPNIDTEDVYNFVITGVGSYTLRFHGDINSLNINYTDAQHIALKEKFKKLIKKKGKERAFLLFMRDEMNFDGLSLYKIKNNGTIQEKYLKSNSKVGKRNCN